MPNKTRPGNGPIRMQTSSPPTDVVYQMTAGGLVTTFGTLGWVVDGEGEGNGHFQRQGVGITYYDDGSFVAVNGPDSYSGTWAPVT